jgi:hypothetical protein
MSKTDGSIDNVVIIKFLVSCPSTIVNVVEKIWYEFFLDKKLSTWVLYF